MYFWHINTAAQRSALIIISVFTLLASVTVAARIWARRLQKMSLAANDYTMIAAMLVTFGITACELLLVLAGGVGMHEGDIVAANPQSLTTFGILIFAIQLLWPVVQALVKVSMCLLYIALFPQTAFRAITITVMTLCAVFSLCFIMVTLLICIPTQLQWDPTVAGFCGDRVALWMWGGILNIVTDCMVIYLPMPMVWRLYLPQGKKLMLTALFGVGIVVTAVSIVRLHCVMRIDFSGDTTYTATNALTWSLVESTLGICAGCLPVVGPAVRAIVPETIAKRWTYSRTSGHQNGESDARPDTRQDEANNDRRVSRSTGEWFSPSATRAPTPHPLAMLDSEKEQAIMVQQTEIPPSPKDTTRRSSMQAREEDVIDSMERGEGIMVKVEWEVSSDTRHSWPRTSGVPSHPPSIFDGGEGNAGA